MAWKLPQQSQSLSWNSTRNYFCFKQSLNLSFCVLLFHHFLNFSASDKLFLLFLTGKSKKDKNYMYRKKRQVYWGVHTLQLESFYFWNTLYFGIMPVLVIEIYYERLINWVLQKSITLIGQLDTAHIFDWLTKVILIY